MAMLLGLFIDRSAAAEAGKCGEDDTSFVALLLDVKPPDQIIGTTLEQHLRAELSSRTIGVCLSPNGSRKPIAEVSLRVEHPDNGPVIATIRIRDRVTDKHIERTVDLTKLPADSRPMAVAASTDELLRASWVELALNDAPPPAMPPPPAVEHAIEKTLRPEKAAPSILEVGASAIGSSYFGHRVAVGGREWIAAWFSPHIGLDLRFDVEVG
jgi:hypothetical protein